MGKKKGANLDLLPTEYTQERINAAPINDVLDIGRLVCSTDYAIRFFKNKNHPKFYKNEEAVRHAVRRAYSQGAFDHAKQIGDALFDEQSFANYLESLSYKRKQGLANKTLFKIEKRARMGLDEYKSEAEYVMSKFIDDVNEDQNVERENGEKI